MRSSEIFSPSGESAEATLSYVILDNRAPSISLAPSNVTLKAHESAVISVTGSDPDGDVMDISLQSPGSGAVTYDAPSRTLRIAAHKAGAGVYKAVMRVTDVPAFTTVQAKSATAEVSYTILPNHAPTVVKYITDMAQSGLRDISVNLQDHFTDVDGEALRYEVTVDDASVASAAVSGYLAVITPKSYGVTTVTITAKDGLDAQAEVSFKVALVNPQQPVTPASLQVKDELLLNIGSPDPVSVEVLVYNAAGARVLRHTFTADVFNPVRLDVSALAPGRYTAKVKFGGATHSLKFVKY